MVPAYNELKVWIMRASTTAAVLPRSWLLHWALVTALGGAGLALQLNATADEREAVREHVTALGHNQVRAELSLLVVHDMTCTHVT